MNHLCGLLLPQRLYRYVSYIIVMSPSPTKPLKKDIKLYIRCADRDTVRGFKRVAADFDCYEDVIIWLNKNYGIFSNMAPPYPPKGGVL